MTDTITAPWTPAQVDALNKFQRAGFVHPFTCANDHDGDRTLLATRSGWICPHCGYTQGWAHAVMLAEPVDPCAGLRLKADSEALRRHADRISKADDPDTATALQWAADEIDRLRTELAGATARIDRLAALNDSLIEAKAVAERDRDRLQSNFQSAWQALAMVREAIETLGPVGVLPSGEAVMGQIGPEPVHGAEALVEGVRKIAAERDEARRLGDEAFRIGIAHQERAYALRDALHLAGDVLQDMIARGVITTSEASAFEYPIGNGVMPKIAAALGGEAPVASVEWNNAIVAAANVAEEWTHGGDPGVAMHASPRIRDRILRLKRSPVPPSQDRSAP